MLWLSGKDDGHRLGRLTAQDGVNIPYREWWMEGAKAVVIFLHGQGGHSGPFTAMGDEMHQKGFNLYAHDHRGFGLSEERRGDIPSYDYFINDTLEMIQLARQRDPRKPIFLLGLSMGGHVALRAAYRAGKSIAGVIALSPGFKLKTPPPWSLVLRGALIALLQPQRYLPALAASVVTTRNQTHLDRAQEDEHWVTSYTARYHFETVRSIHKAKREISRLQVPVLFMQAGEDYLVCPEESRRFFDRVRHPDKKFRLMEGLCHNLVAEPEMPDIAQEIALWIEKRLP